jgi:hypothetical protein
MTRSAQPTTERPESEVLISADSHVAEPEELWERLPSTLRAQGPALETLPDGGERYTIEGSTISLPRGRTAALLPGSADSEKAALPEQAAAACERVLSTAGCGYDHR